MCFEWGTVKAILASVGLIPCLMASMGLRLCLAASHFHLELASFHLLLYRKRLLLYVLDACRRLLICVDQPAFVVLVDEVFTSMESRSREAGQQANTHGNQSSTDNDALHKRVSPLVPRAKGVPV